MAKMALDQGHSFGVDVIPDFVPYVIEGQTDEQADENLVKTIEWLKLMKGVQDSDISALYLRMCWSEDHYLVASRILRKDLRCGVQAKTLNKVSPGLIYRVPYQRCSGPEALKKMIYPARLERKANGMFAYMSTGSGSFLTRNGQVFSIKGSAVEKELEAWPDSGWVLIGELVFVDENEKALDRAVSNGMINSFIKGDGDPAADLSKLRAFVWGIITKEEFAEEKSRVSMTLRMSRIELAIENCNLTSIKFIEHCTVGSLEEAQRVTNQYISQGEEGTVLKSISDYFIWEDSSASPYQIKLKAEAEAEFILVSAYYGDKGKKYETMLGGIVVKSADGKVVTEVGSGFTDGQRKLGVDHWNSLGGKICTIKFNGVTTKEGSNIRALDHPRFIEIREDKDEAEADTLDYCLTALKGGL